MNQKYSSKDTSINVVNKVYKKYNFKPNTTILDYGGGKYDTNTEYMKGKNIEVLVYDKYNRTEEHNREIKEKVKHQNLDYIVCSNVLNVIFEDDIIDSILKEISSYKKAITLIAIYEGNKSGVGTETTKGYQRNEKVNIYIDKIKKYFNIINIKNGIIECESKEKGEKDD
jgi:hypothetical protein